jgi:ABC-type cobalamin transport system ATPase subunit
MPKQTEYPPIYMNEWQFLTLYLADNERKGTIERVRDYLDAHPGPVGNMRDVIALAWGESEEKNDE